MISFLTYSRRYFSHEPLQSRVSEVQHQHRRNREQNSEQKIDSQDDRAPGNNTEHDQKKHDHKRKLRRDVHEQIQRLVQRKVPPFDSLAPGTRRAREQGPSAGGRRSDPGRRISVVHRGARFDPIAVQALDHPEEEEILSGEFQVSLVDQSEGQEVAPRARDEERDGDLLGLESDHGPLEAQHAVLAERVSAPEDVRYVLDDVERLAADRTLEPFFFALARTRLLVVFVV